MELSDAQIREELSELDRREQAIDAEIEELLRYLESESGTEPGAAESGVWRSEAAAAAREGSLLRTHLELLDQKQQLLKEGFDFESLSEASRSLRQDIILIEQMSSSVSGGVKQLDVTLTNCMSALSYVRALQQLTESVAGVQRALSKNDFVAAARFLNNYHSLSKDLPLRAEQKEAMEDAQRKLLEILEAKLTDAVERRQTDEVLEYTTLYEVYNRSREGMSRLCDYVVSICSDRMQTQIHDLINAPFDQSLFFRSVSRFFQEASESLLRFKPYLAKFHQIETPCAELIKMVALTADANISLSPSLSRSSVFPDSSASHFPKVLHYYSEVRDLTVVNRTLKKADAPIDTYAISLLNAMTGEIAFLSQSVMNFYRFLSAQLDDSMEGHPYSKEDVLPNQTEMRAGLGHLIQIYGAMERNVLTRTFELSKQDRLNEEHRTTELVDTNFYALRSSLTEALNQGHLFAIQTMIPVYRFVLKGLLYDHFKALLEAAKERRGSAMLQLEVPLTISLELSVRSFPVTMNNIETSIQYIQKLYKESLESGRDLFQSMGEEEPFCNELKRLLRVADFFKMLLDESYNAILASLDSMLRGAVDRSFGASSTSYTLTEAQYESLNPSYIAVFVDTLSETFARLRSTLSSSNYHTLALQLLNKLASYMETQIMKKSYSQFGGMQLDRDIRHLVTQLTQITTLSVRNQFLRLSQLASILSLDSLEDVKSYYQEIQSSLSWKLSQSNVLKICSLRTDFSKKRISTLF